MNASTFVAIVANPYISPPSCFCIDSDTAEKAVDIAIRNKIFPLFYERCAQLSIQLPDRSKAIAEEYMRRRTEQLKEMTVVANLCCKLGIKFAFFKTFRPFTYIPDDIDIIIKNDVDFRKLVHALLRDKGYELRMVGPFATILRKVTNRTYVDLDIHRAITAGHLQLLKSESIWNNIIYRDIGNEFGFKVPVLCEDYEVVNIAAHSLFKDFSLNIPTFYLATHVLLCRNIRQLQKIAEQEGLAIALSIMLFITLRINEILYGEDMSVKNVELPLDDVFFTKVIEADIRQGLTMPYPYPLPLTIYAYVWKAWFEVRRLNIRVLAQLAKQPSSKGIRLLINYFGLLKDRLSFHCRLFVDELL